MESGSTDVRRTLRMAEPADKTINLRDVNRHGGPSETSGGRRDEAIVRGECDFADEDVF
jgi:hypothetical protein